MYGALERAFWFNFSCLGALER